MRSQPAIALLSNGSYSVMITSAGTGSSAWRDLDVTRWREDATRDCWGQFYYVRDVHDDRAWSIGAQPLVGAGDPPDSDFRDDRAELRRRDGDIEARCTICVVPDADAELRVITLVNHGRSRRELELTSYAEVCLNGRRADQAHPAFGKLFLETEFDPQYGALLARRRPRGAKERPVWAIHASTSEASGATPTHDLTYETDRARFLGRGRTPANPAALDSGARLSRTTGPVLDPIFSLRHRIALDAGMTTRVAFMTGAADTREAAMRLSERFGEFRAIDAAFADAHVYAERELRELALVRDEMALFNRLAASVVFTTSELRDRDAVAANRLGQRSLWPHAISGDLPIVLARVTRADDETVVRQLVRWHRYMRRRRLQLDLVILDERADEPAERLKKELQASIATEMLGKSGGVFVLAARQLSTDDAVLLAAASRAVLGGGRGSLAEQIDHDGDSPPESEAFAPEGHAAKPAVRRIVPPNGLLFWNGLGGFSQDGREYVIAIDRNSRAAATLPPAPWTNVLANPQFGCLVTEGGLGYTWAGNSQMNRLTPWSNDPTSDPPSEVVYLRDEETGEVWTPTPLPLGPMGTVTVRHGQGYTRYSHVGHDLDQDLLVCVPPDDPVKLVRLTVRNESDRPRHLTVTYYAEWVLGTARENAPLQVVCEHDSESGAVLARNAWAGDFSGKIAFAACGRRAQSVTADRAGSSHTSG